MPAEKLLRPGGAEARTCPRAVLAGMQMDIPRAGCAPCSASLPALHPSPGRQSKINWKVEIKNTVSKKLKRENYLYKLRLGHNFLFIFRHKKF